MAINLFKAGFLFYALGAQGVGGNQTVGANQTVANPVANQTVNRTGYAAGALQACNADLATCNTDLKTCSANNKELTSQLDFCRSYATYLFKETVNCSRDLDAWESYAKSLKSYSEFLKSNSESLENSLYLCRERQNTLKNCTDQLKDCEQNTTSEKTNKKCYDTVLGMSPLLLLGGFCAAVIIVQSIFIIKLHSRIEKLKELPNPIPSGQDPSGQDISGIILDFPNPTAPPAPRVVDA